MLVILPSNKAIAESLLDALMRFTGIDITTSRVRGSFINGNLWLIKINKSGVNEPKKITDDGLYHSPLWVPGSSVILAIKENKLIQFNTDDYKGGIRHVFSKKTILLGFDKSNANLILILQGSLPAVFSLSDSQIIPLPYDKKNGEDRDALGLLLNDYRNYGNTEVFIDKQTRADGKSSFKKINRIHIKTGDQDIAISCTGTCAQPALNRDGQQLVFVGQ